jgi:putative inorganic carbon (HCO3(-)) transporter
MRDLGLSLMVTALLAMAVARPFAGVLAWSWISFMNPHKDVYGFAATMPWAMLAFVATVFGCVVAREPKRPAINALTVLLLLFGCWVTLTSLTALGPAAQVWWKWDRTIKTIAGLLLTASMLTTEHRIVSLVWLMAISLGYYGVKGGIFTIMTGGAFQVLGPAESMIADRNHIAVGLLVSVPLLNWLRLHARHHLVRLGLIAAMGLTLLAAIGSQSRGALVALLATGFVFWLRSRGKILSGLAVAAVIAAVIAFMPDSWVQRMNTIQSFEADQSAMGRILIWKAAWHLTLMRPITGVGFRGVYQQDLVNLVDPAIKARADHSIWFEVLSEHGFPGFAIWLAILGCGIVWSFRITRLARGRKELLWAFDLARMGQVAIVAYLSGGSLLSLAYWDYLWTLLVVLGATKVQVAKAVAAAVPAAAAQPAARWQRGQAAPAGAGAAVARP